MGVGYRIFFMQDDGTLLRIPVTSFEKLTRPDSDFALPLFASKQVKYALIILETENGKPVLIQHAEYGILYFDNDGRLDRGAFELASRLVGQFADLLPNNETSRKILNGCRRFAKKRYIQEFKWEPTPEIQNLIYQSIFGGDAF